MVTLKATLYQGEEEKQRSIATFEVEEYGYHARLSPAVVLVTPDELCGNSDDFRFAPTLSWLHHHTPRPESESLYAPLLRALQPGLGIHSAFIPFASNEEIQIGLGGTVSLWEDRLQVGAGYNLMADSRDDGRFYFFLGTDLIGLLQTVGID